MNLFELQTYQISHCLTENFDFNSSAVNKFGERMKTIETTSRDQRTTPSEKIKWKKKEIQNRMDSVELIVAANFNEHLENNADFGRVTLYALFLSLSFAAFSILHISILKFTGKNKRIYFQNIHCYSSVCVWIFYPTDLTFRFCKSAVD